MRKQSERSSRDLDDAPKESITLRERLRSLLPILDWAKNYKIEYLRPDIIAGVTVAAFAVPESLAYASLAGLNPEVGFYAMMTAALIYLLFGTSRQLSIGPTSALSILVATTLSTLVANNPAQYAAFAALTGLFVGLIAIGAWLLRLGFIAKMISSTVLIGFTAGVAFYIAAAQIPRLISIKAASGGFIEKVLGVISGLGDAHLPTLIVGAVAIAAMLLMERAYRKIPAALVVVIVSVILMTVTGLKNEGIATVGSMPAGLPTIAIPIVPEVDLIALLYLAIATFLVAYVEHMGTARTFARKNRYRIDDNQELLAMGASNLANSFFRGYVVGGTYSRSAVADELQAKTQLASGITGAMMIVVVLFFADFLSNLPEAILSAVVLVAVSRLVRINEFRRIYRISKRQFAIAIAAFLGVLVAGLIAGVAIGVVLSIFDLLDRIYHPQVTILGRLPDSDDFMEVKRHPESEQLPNLLVLKANHSILFFNADNVRHKVLKILTDEKRPIALVVLDLESSPIIDIDGADMIEDLSEDLKSRNIDLRLAIVSESAADVLEDTGVASKLGGVEPDTTVLQVIKKWRMEKGITGDFLVFGSHGT